ncbi:MAG: Chromate resistance protein ChrB [Acidimicrobiales bacterium]
MMSACVEVAGATVGVMSARVKPSAPSPGQGWLLLSVSSSGPSSSLRVYTWRKLKGLGGHYVQQSVCLLPDRPETQRTVQRLLAKVRDEGGEARLLHVAITDPVDDERKRKLTGRLVAHRWRRGERDSGAGPPPSPAQPRGRRSRTGPRWRRSCPSCRDHRY